MEGVDITHAEVYAALAAGKATHTSQPSPGEIARLWDRMLAEGADEIVCIPMSSSLSGACDTAKMLARDYEGKVWVVDNHRISVTQRSSVMDALTLSRRQKSAPEIRQILEESAYDASIYICVSTLQHLKQSNRITAAGASLASALNLHPVLKIRGGKLDAQCVVRGEKHTQKTLIRLMETDLENQFRHIPPCDLSLSTAGTYRRPEDARAWTDLVQSAFPDFQVRYEELSCSIACHVGCDALAIALSVLKRT
jgi:DegV family protein with EDD domain